MSGVSVVSVVVESARGRRVRALLPVLPAARDTALAGVLARFARALGCAVRVLPGSVLVGIVGLAAVWFAASSAGSDSERVVPAAVVSDVPATGFGGSGGTDQCSGQQCGGVDLTGPSGGGYPGSDTATGGSTVWNGDTSHSGPAWPGTSPWSGRGDFPAEWTSGGSTDPTVAGGGFSEWVNGLVDRILESMNTGSTTTPQYPQTPETAPTQESAPGDSENQGLLGGVGGILDGSEKPGLLSGNTEDLLGNAGGLGGLAGVLPAGFTRGLTEGVGGNLTRGLGDPVGGLTRGVGDALGGLTGGPGGRPGGLLGGLGGGGLGAVAAGVAELTGRVADLAGRVDELTGRVEDLEQGAPAPGEPVWLGQPNGEPGLDEPGLGLPAGPGGEGPDPAGDAKTDGRGAELDELNQAGGPSTEDFFAGGTPLRTDHRGDLEVQSGGWRPDPVTFSAERPEGPAQIPWTSGRFDPREAGSVAELIEAGGAFADETLSTALGGLDEQPPGRPTTPTGGTAATLTGAPGPGGGSGSGGSGGGTGGPDWGAGTSLLSRLLSTAAGSNGGDAPAAQRHRELMGWRDAAHGPHDPQPTSTTRNDSNEPTGPGRGGDEQLGRTALEQPTPTGAGRDDRPAAGSGEQARLVGGGLAVPTTDGGELTLTPVTRSPHAQLTPDLARGRYLIEIAGPQAPGAYDFRLDMPAGARAEANPEGGVDILGADGQPIQNIAAPWAKDATGQALPTRFELVPGADGSTVLRQHVGFDERTAFPV